MTRICFLVAAMFGWCIGLGASAMACETYTSLNTQDMKEYRDKLQEVGADPLDKFFAFEQLFCSDNPVMRAFAAETALQGNSDPIIRQQVMLKIMLAMKRIEIEISAAPDSTEEDKAVVKKSGGKFVLIPEYISESEGCISFRRECEVGASFYLKGSKADLGFDAYNTLNAGGNSAIGDFELTDANELVGSINLDRFNQSYRRVNAVIKLH